VEEALRCCDAAASAAKGSVSSGSIEVHFMFPTYRFGHGGSVSLALEGIGLLELRRSAVRGIAVRDIVTGCCFGGAMSSDAGASCLTRTSHFGTHDKPGRHCSELQVSKILFLSIMEHIAYGDPSARHFLGD
jgi:hypothetical protein